MGDTGLTWLTIVLTYDSLSSYHRSFSSRRCRLCDDDWADFVVTLVTKILVIGTEFMSRTYFTDC